MRPCLVCSNENIGELSRHHLIPKYLQRDLGLAPKRQHTVKLCRDNFGCRSHLDFHNGRVSTAVKIRNNLHPRDIQWMVELVGSKWVKENYPTKLPV